MATATVPTGAPISIPSSSMNALSQEPQGDVLYEVVDGRFVEAPPMGAYESDVANWLAELLNEVAREGRRGRAFVELLFRIDVAKDLKRRPDVAFVTAARWPAGTRVPKGEAWDMVPDLAVEVVSKSNTAEEILAKLEDYFRTGTLLVWVVYPSVHQVYVYTSPTEVQILAEPADLDGGRVISDFHLSLHRLFEDALDAS
jgi:Uma2 family endonuclease